MRRLCRGVVLVGLLCLWEGSPAQAEIPKTLTFQGHLTDTQGVPLSGIQTVTFRLYDAATGGTLLWEERKNLPVADGVFSTVLGTQTALALAFDRPYWVELQVGAERLSPRQPLSASPYAFHAKHVEGLAIVGGNVGIGTAAPGVKLDINGDLRASNFRTLSLTRTMPVVINQAVDLGTLTLMHGGGALEISVVVPSNSFSVAKIYLLPLQYALTLSGWTTALAVADSGAYGGNDFALDVNVINHKTTLRVRRTAGNTPGTVYVVITYVGMPTDIFTPSTAVSTVVAPTKLFAPTVLMQRGGRVGIGTAAPTQALEVAGAVRLVPSGAPTMPQAGTIYFDGTTKHFFGFDGTAWKQLDM